MANNDRLLFSESRNELHHVSDVVANCVLSDIVRSFGLAETPSCQEPQRESLLRPERAADAARSTSIPETRGRGALTGLDPDSAIWTRRPFTETVRCVKLLCLSLVSAAAKRLLVLHQQ